MSRSKYLITSLLLLLCGCIGFHLHIAGTYEYKGSQTVEKHHPFLATSKPSATSQPSKKNVLNELIGDLLDGNP